MSRLGKRLRFHARTRPDARAVFAGDRWWTYGELASTAGAIAEQLALRAGDVVAIAIARGIEAVLASCAAALADAVPALIDPADAALAHRTLARLQPAHVVARPGVLDGAAALTGGELEPGPPVPWSPIARPGLAFIIYTSGTTVDAKGVAWSETRAAFDWRAAPPPADAHAAPTGVTVPLCTALGLQDVLRTLHDGRSTVLLDTPFRVGLEQARALGVSRLRLTPTHVDVVLATAVELPALRSVVVASAPIAPKRLRALAARLPHARIGRSYGLTESGAAAMLWLDEHPKRLRTVGRAIAFRRITIRDAEGRVLPPGTWGEVAIDMPAWNAGDGYLDAPPELARRFANGTLYTGDRGKLDGRGFLVLGARAAEILKIGGRSVSAPHIEAALRKTPGAPKLAVTGVPDRALGEVACCIYMPAPDARSAALAEAALRADELPRWVLPRPRLPRTASGKLRRGRLAAEAARWTAAFPQIVAPDHRTVPAYELDPRAAIADAGLVPWFGDPGDAARAGRVLALVERRPVRVLALAYIQCDRECRFACGPFAAAQPHGEVTAELLDVFAAEVIRLAQLLPGPQTRLVRVRAGEAAPVAIASAAAAVAALARAISSRA